MIDHIVQTHKFTRNIPAPSVPKKYNPNDRISDFSEFVSGMEEGFEFEEDDDDEEDTVI
jgi:hypothetical protein